MYSTKNDTTTVVNQSQATVLCVSGKGSEQLVTWELVYPRFIHSELMTHRMFSRNAASSRATPVKRQVEEVLNNPAFFDFVGVNRPGMSADVPLDPETLEKFRTEWELLGAHVAKTVEHWASNYNIHKQTINRALEPWTYIRTIVSATDTDNFFRLRLAADAQPEIQSLARAMRASLEAASPDAGYLLDKFRWHIPYADVLKHTETDFARLIIRSVAACARVSVVRGDAKKTTFDEDLKLVQSLYKNRHMSPFEHVALYTGGEEYANNFMGWESLRSLLERGVRFGAESRAAQNALNMVHDMWGF